MLSPPRRQLSVKERSAYFEQLSGRSDIVRLRSADRSKALPNRPVSVSSDFIVCLDQPPEKPKRTFAHDVYMEGQISPGEGTRGVERKCAALSNNKILTPIASTPVINNGTSPMRKYRSSDDVYDLPVISPSADRNHGAKFHESLYYASTDLTTPLTSSAYNSSNVDITSNNNNNNHRAVVASASQGTPASLRRKLAFKKNESRKGRDRSNFRASCDENQESFECVLERRVSRAKLVRRRTLAQYDNERKASVRAEAPLFDSVLLVSIDESAHAAGAPNKPVVIFQYPPEKDDRLPAELFFPDYSRVRPIGANDYWQGDEEFVIALTDDCAVRRNAYCLKFLPRRDDEEPCYPIVLVIISPITNSVFYLDLARNTIAYAKKSHARLSDFLSSVVLQRYPSARGSCLVIVEKDSYGGQKRIEVRNQGTILGKTGCSDVIERLTPEITACAVAALLGDQRVLIAGNSVCITTKTVQVLEAIIRPFCWPHTFIPVVPDNLFDLCHNPTPYLMGILRNNLAPIRELILEEDGDGLQDFVFIDIDTGLVTPRPPPYDGKLDVQAWRLQVAFTFCERLGMPKKVCLSLIKALRGAISGGCGPAADYKIELAMMTWFSNLFGHYRFAGCHIKWDEESKKQLLLGQSCKYTRHYLLYLVETIMFDEWIRKRQQARIEQTAKEKNGEKIEEPIPGSEEALNKKIDELWLANFESLTPRPIAKMMSKVTAALHLSSKKTAM